MRMEKQKGCVYTVQSVEKALDILCGFSMSEPELGISELSARLHMYKGTIYKTLKTLEKRGFVLKNMHNQKYRLGFKLFELGNVALCGSELRNVALPIMRELNLLTNETVTLNVVDNNQRVCLEKIESTQVIRSFDQSIGGRNPLYLGAAGKVLLAFLPQEEIGIIIAGIKDGKAVLIKELNTAQLRKQLEQIRVQGYAHCSSERSVGSTAVSAPIRDYTGEVVAGISLSGPESRFTEQYLPEFVKLVISASDQISSRIGAKSQI